MSVNKSFIKRMYRNERDVLKVCKNKLYLEEFNSIVESEQRRLRIIVIVQNNLRNRFSSIVLVAPVSTRKDKLLPIDILIKQFGRIGYDSISLLKREHSVTQKCIKRIYRYARLEIRK